MECICDRKAKDLWQCFLLCSMLKWMVKGISMRTNSAWIWTRNALRAHSHESNDGSHDHIWTMDISIRWWSERVQIPYDFNVKYGMSYHDDQTQLPLPSHKWEDRRCPDQHEDRLHGDLPLKFWGIWWVMDVFSTPTICISFWSWECAGYAFEDHIGHKRSSWLCAHRMTSPMTSPASRAVCILARIYHCQFDRPFCILNISFFNSISPISLPFWRGDMSKWLFYILMLSKLFDTKPNLRLSSFMSVGAPFSTVLFCLVGISNIWTFILLFRAIIESSKTCL